MTPASAWAVARGQFYRFLAMAFLRSPTEPFVAPFLDEAFLGELAERFGRETVRDLAAFRDGFHGDYEALDQEYQELFAVPLGRYVTPYEAVYRDERVVGEEVVRGLLMGPSSLAVKALYREAGLEIPADLLELPDHVGLELGCMQGLCAAEAKAWQAGDTEAQACARRLQRRLLEEHLLQWVPALCTRIRDSAPGPFYRGIATLTEAVLKQDARALAQPAEEPTEGCRCA
jgi:TorA maturation chaperone TorD